MTKIKPELVAGLAQIGYNPAEVVQEFAQDAHEDDSIREFLDKDPNGIDQHAPGAKLDAGKCDVGLLFESFPHALYGVAQVATFGANKYTRNGWKSVPHGNERYAAAEGRHKLLRYQGEYLDSESQLPHQFHEAWNVLAQLELALTKKEA